MVGILVEGFIDLYVLPGKGLSLLPASVLTGKVLSLSSSSFSPPQNPKAILIENRDVNGAVLFHAKELQSLGQYSVSVWSRESRCGFE